MLMLKVVSSGSQGNCMVLETENKEILLIDLGVKVSEIKRMINYRVSDIIACLVSHKHL